MKKIRLLSLIMAMMILPTGALVGCGKKDGSEADGKTVVEIGVVAKGYGSDFAVKLAEAYNKTQESVFVKVAKTSPTPAYPDTQLFLGPKRNTVDLFFTVTNTVFTTQNDSTFYHWADLSDVYNSVATGYAEADGTVTIKDIMDKTYVKDFTYKDGKQYSMPWTSGVVGLLYNKTKWESTNANLKTAGKTELELPVTTNEMFTLFDRIKTSEVQTASNNTYAFSYSGGDSYMHFMFNSLWPQYEGKIATENFFQGKDVNGTYTADIYNTKGREYAYEVVRSMIMKSNGYVSDFDMDKKYDQEQLGFLRGESFFSCNGDWMEREASKQFKPGEADVEMIRTPILSKIVECDAIKSDFTGNETANDLKLATVVRFIDKNYINGNNTPTESDATSLNITLDTLQYIYDARLSRHALIDFVAVVPDYSSELDETKDFLKFMYSKEGQEIVMEATYGCSAPLTVDYSQMNYYQVGTTYSKSRLNIISKSIPYGNAMNYPMEYLGGLKIFPEGKIASAFGGTTPQSARSFMLEEYNENKSVWKNKMQYAGVSNN